MIADTAAQPLLVPHGGPPRGALERPGDVIRDLQNANAWLTLLSVQDDPGMAEIMNTYLDQLESGISAKQGKRAKLHKRVAFVFVSSPDSVTPVHYDIEHSLLMQVSGRKTVSIGRFESDAVRRREFDRYWNGPAPTGGSKTYLQRSPRDLDARARGVHPPGTPHWVHNGPDISLSVTLTYFTAATVRVNRVEDFNAYLRRRHMNPREPGHSATVDTAKVCALGALVIGRHLRSMSPGTKQRDSEASAGGAAPPGGGELDRSA